MAPAGPPREAGFDEEPRDQLMLLTGDQPAFVQAIRGRNDGGVPPPLASDAELRAVAEGREPAFFADRKIEGAHVRVYVARLPGENLTIFAARSLTEVDNALGTLRWALGALALAGIALAVLLSLARHDARPCARWPSSRRPPSTSPPRATSRRRIEAHGDDELVAARALVQHDARGARPLAASAAPARRRRLARAAHAADVACARTWRCWPAAGRSDPEDRERLRSRP